MEATFTAYLQEHRQEITDFLRILVEINSFSGNHQGVYRVGQVLADYLMPLGFEETLYRREHVGYHRKFIRRGNFGSTKLLFLVHLDTVFPPESGFTSFSLKGDTAFGPGVIDMKGGIVVLCATFKMLAELQIDPLYDYTIMAVGDEEIGSEDSRILIQEAAFGKDYAFCFECGGANGELVTARKGVGTFRLDITGKAAHAGNSYTKGVDANYELARKLVAIRELTDLEKGTTVNVGEIQGGIGANTISPSASMKIDLRFEDQEEGERVHIALVRIANTSFVEGSTATLSGRIQRPVMVETDASLRFLERINEAAGGNLQKERRGGGSDANLTASFGVPTIDGFGPSGGDDHTHNEYLRYETLFERIALLAEILTHPL